MRQAARSSVPTWWLSGLHAVKLGWRPPAPSHPVLTTSACTCRAAAGGGDRETAAIVQEALRYRLMRLVGQSTRQLLALAMRSSLPLLD